MLLAWLVLHASCGAVRKHWEDISGKCPGSFHIQTHCSTQQDELLRRAKAKFLAIFKVAA